jgi:hypothetical protein
LERFFRCLPVLGVSLTFFFCCCCCFFCWGGGRTLLSAGLLDLHAGTDTDETVAGLELLEGLGGIVDHGEASGLATTVLCAETEDGDLVLVGLVQVGKLLTKLILGDVGAVGVQDVTKNKSRISIPLSISKKSNQVENIQKAIIPSLPHSSIRLFVPVSI